MVIHTRYVYGITHCVMSFVFYFVLYELFKSLFIAKNPSTNLILIKRTENNF